MDSRPIAHNPRAASAQATQPTYELHSLGWKAFQQLCATVTSEVWGQTVQGYFDSNDGGRDGAFWGTWTPKAGEAQQGAFTVQCKFTAKSGHTLRLSALKDELEKAARLAARRLCDVYVLCTNCHLTGTNDEEVRAAFEAIPNIKVCLVYGTERLSQIIRESSRLRMLVPRIYGLGDLSTILDERALAQSKEILSALGDDVQKFVITDAYRRAAKALIDHGFVILLGEPACGKSAIATALAMGALDEWGNSTFKITGASEFVAHSNPNDPHQFFWVDDVFGATQLDVRTVTEWNQVFPHVRAALRRGAKVVFTSRSYIFKNAGNFLKESALPVIGNAQVVIRVEDVSLEERRQILYNHVRLGVQPTTFKTALKPYLEQLAAHQSFSPEIARRLGNPAFTSDLTPNLAELNRFAAEPMAFLQEIIRTVDSASKCAIALVFMRSGWLESPVALSTDEEAGLEMLGSSKGDIISALAALDGSLLLKMQEQGKTWWRFKHPTIRDAFADMVARNTDLMDIYLKGTPLSQLLREITGGDVGLEGAKVVVPPSRYNVVLKRMMSAPTQDRGTRNDILSFLGWRCATDFLECFLRANPGFLAGLAAGAYLYAVDDVEAIAAFHKARLLPESERARHVSDIRQIVLETPDTGFTLERVKSLFTDEEYAELLADVRKLATDLNDCIWNWHLNEPSGEDADDYYRELESALDEFSGLFPDDAEVEAEVSRALGRIADWKAELSTVRPSVDKAQYKDDYGASVATTATSARSIFDDIDI